MPEIDSSGHIVVPVRYMNMKFPCYYMKKKPLWTNFQEIFRTFELFGCIGGYRHGVGQVVVCSSSKTWKFLCTYGVPCDSTNSAIESEISCNYSVLQDLTLEARDWLSTGKPLLNKHRIAIKLWHDDLLKEAIGIKVQARRFGYSFRNYAEGEKDRRNEYRKWIIIQGKRAVDMLFSAEVNTAGGREIHSLQQAVTFVLEDILNMSLDRKVHIGFDIPNEDVLIKDLSNAAKAVFNRKVSKDASRHAKN